MTREDVMQGLTDIFRDEFDDEELVIYETTTSEDIEDWDSFANVNMVAAIEHAFHMKFAMGEVNKMKNVGEMLDIIMERMQV